jgi:preprotein translocase SecE subunit
MAVAVKNSSQAASTSSMKMNNLAVGSLAGAIYVLAGYCVVFFGIPWVWWSVLQPDLPSFVNLGLFLLVMLAGIAGLFVVGMRLLGPSPAHGARAGVFWVVVLIVAAGLIIQVLGQTIENWLGNGIVPMATAAVLALAVVYFMFRPLFRPRFEKWLGQLEDQGWFTTKGYKASQGLKVRRGTILGLLILGGCGIYTMMSRSALLGDWDVDVPFMDGWTLTLLPARRYTLMLLLSAGLLWFAWRIVNLPVFADFLIATEAEINKVSWTTRRRLVQDSIVVLVTVFLMTLFLLIVDILWFWLLSNPKIGVLKIDTSSQQVGPGSEKPEY